jgi:hypothetical protein
MVCGQLVRQAERLLIECQQSADPPDYTLGHRYTRAAEEGLSEELLGSLCYLVQVKLQHAILSASVSVLLYW